MKSISRILLAAFFALVLLLPARAAERPNVLWLYLEDVSGWFGCYGDSIIETPNIDALAESGLKLTRFYTPAGVCSTTRSAIVTGMMQTSIGAHNHRSCREEFRGQVFEDYDINYLPDYARPLPIRFREAGYWTFNMGGKDDYNFEWDAEEFYDRHGRWQGPETVDALGGDALEGKPADQPFFGQLQLKGGKLGKRVPEVVDRSIVPVPPYYPDVAEVREEIAHHYDCLLETDEQVGRIVEKLKDAGLYENTLIFLFSDHGMKLHRHKQLLYEGGIHMPCIVAGPGIEAGAVRGDLVSGIDISAASLAAAGIAIPREMEGRDFLAPDHEPREFVVSARDRCDYTIEKIRAVVTPRFKYLRNYLTDRPYMQPTYKDSWDVTRKFREMMTQGEMNETQLLLFGDERVPEEFYDLENDPHEIRNLADDPEFAGELERHSALLAGWVEETGDRGQVPESEIGLLCTLKRWGDECVNPEYDRVRYLLRNDDGQ